MLFVDTEWADSVANGCQLVSIGLVGRDDRLQWYAERDPLPSAPPDFVRVAVYPLLERGPSALSDAALCASLRAFIEHVRTATGETPTIACDYGMDRALFLDAWCGLDATVPDIGRPDVHWFDLNHLNLHYTLGLEAHFADNPDARRRRHHALVDAFAARAGYLHAIRIQAGR